MRKVILFLSLMALPLSLMAKDNPEIQFLLEEVGKSNLQFVRNGKTHTSQEAEKHLRHKLTMAKRMFWIFGPEKDISVDEFIEKIASQSSTTGQDYKIRFSDGKETATRDWLRMTLKKYQKP